MLTSHKWPAGKEEDLPCKTEGSKGASLSMAEARRAQEEVDVENGHLNSGRAHAGAEEQPDHRGRARGKRVLGSFWGGGPGDLLLLGS